MDNVDKDLLKEIADMNETPKGAYNIRKNGQGIERQVTENVNIVTKKDKPGKDGKKIGLVMQPGGFSVVNNYAARGADFNIPVASADDEIKAIKDKLYFTDGKEPIEVTNNFSKKIHAGEGNLTFGSHFDGTSYTARIMPVEANEFPNSTFDAIDERLGEIITYTNCTQRKVEIVLPAAAKDTALGKFYKDALEKLKSKQLASITEQVVSGKMTKEIGDRCEEYIKHGLDVVFE